MSIGLINLCCCIRAICCKISSDEISVITIVIGGKVKKKYKQDLEKYKRNIWKYNPKFVIKLDASWV